MDSHLPDTFCIDILILEDDDDDDDDVLILYKYINNLFRLYKMKLTKGKIMKLYKKKQTIVEEKKGDNVAP